MVADHPGKCPEEPSGRKAGSSQEPQRPTRSVATQAQQEPPSLEGRPPHYCARSLEQTAVTARMHVHHFRNLGRDAAEEKPAEG